MTGSSHPNIDAAVTAWNTGRQADALNMLRDSPDLVAKCRAEIARLEDRSGPRQLLHPTRPDAVSLRLHQHLTAMLDAAAATE